MQTLYALLIILNGSETAHPIAKELTQDACLEAFKQTAYKPDMYALVCFPTTAPAVDS